MQRPTGKDRRGTRTWSRAMPIMFALMPALLLTAFHTGGETALGLTAGLCCLISIAALRLGLPAERGANADRDERTQFEAALARRLSDPASASGLTVFVCGIDDYATLTKRLGEERAGRLVQDILQRLRGTFLSSEEVVCMRPPRIVVAPAQMLDLETSVQFALDLQRICARPFREADETLTLTVSVGFAPAGRLSRPAPESLIGAATHALDIASRQGPGRLRAFDLPADGRRIEPRFDTASVLRALENGEIRPFFQPQISTDTGDLTGAEALGRWVHPRLGVLPPGEFLPVIEAQGLSRRLSETMLVQSLGCLLDWDQAGLNVPRISVNFGERELADPHLADRVQIELERHGLSPDRLSIEILETVLAAGPEDTVTRNLQSLNALGCHIELDDFGTGHAAITTIRRFPISGIKIDRSFVKSMDTARDQQNMVAAILTMAEQLSLETIAEGVETAGEHAMLSQLGCAHVQGFAIARPMPAEALPEWIARHRAALPRPGGMAPVLFPQRESPPPLRSRRDGTGGGKPA